MGSLTEQVFCAFCKLERKVYVKKHIDWTNVLFAVVIAFLFSHIVWGGLDGRLVMVATVAIIMSEVFLNIRWRMSLTCPHCSFDPILYKTDRKRVISQVKERLEKVQASDQFMFKKNNPLRNLPIRQKTEDGIKIVPRDSESSSELEI